MGVPKIPAKIFIFEEILKGTFQLSVEHLTFHLELCRCASPRCCCLNSVHHITQDLECCQDKSIYISTASLQELKELGKYEYFFRVYHTWITTMKQTKVL